MSDYNLKAEITADASGYEAGIKKAQKASKNLSSTVSSVIKGLGKNGLVGALGAVGLASSGLSATLGTVVKVARQVSKAINECTEAYKTQLVAERALNTAIENNPFVTGASADALKQFASEMQKVSNYGDEELIPMMTNLISLGRTESETMQIMSVAMDMSAGMGISLDSAITQLNATLNGNIGRLGQQNAELKGLTEEELKQGKAIEILGEKFKGLSSATADTSKQLQNIKGDFKEALGQFTLPSSDMWNTFWAGFYEKGIAVIQKFNDYLDVKIIGKQLVENLYNNARIVAKANKLKVEDVFMDFRYVREELSYLNDSELATLQKTLERQKERTQGEERILATVKQMLQNKKLEADQERANAEAEAKKARELEAQKMKEKELAELRKKQAEEKEKALKIEGEWGDKLFAIRIENLERTREKELENEELTQEEREAINEFYGEQILAMKIKQIEKEREETLAQENLTEEAKRSINLYYENEITQAKADEQEKRLKNKKKTDKEEIKEEEKKYNEMVKMAVDATKKLAETFKNVAKKIASTMKSVISGIGNIFSKLFEFNPDEALTNLLIFEDKVLTFFMETLPKLPKFFESAVNSIVHTIQQILTAIDFDVLADILGQIVNSLGGLITSISKHINANADKLTKGFVKLVKAIIQNIADWIASGGWKEFLELLFTIQVALETAITENIDEFAETVAKMLPDLVDFLIKSIVSASRTFGKIAKTLMPLIAKIITAIVDVITSNEVLNASLEAIEGLVEGLIPAIVEIIVRAGPKLMNFLSLKLPSIVPQLIITVINAILNALETMDFSEIVEGFFDGVEDALSSFSVGGLADSLSKLLKKIMSLEFWNNVLSNFATSIGTLLAEVIEEVFSNPLSLLGIGSSGKGSSGGSSSKEFDPVDLVDPLGLRHLFGFANGTNGASKGLAIVGEAGPELVRFNGGEQVLNTRNTQKALSGAGGKSNTFNVTFNNTKDTTAFTMIQQLKQYNRQMAINGIM